VGWYELTTLEQVSLDPAKRTVTFEQLRSVFFSVRGATEVSRSRRRREAEQKSGYVASSGPLRRIRLACHAVCGATALGSDRRQASGKLPGHTLTTSVAFIQG
jgi:hypothetical protein